MHCKQAARGVGWRQTALQGSQRPLERACRPGFLSCARSRLARYHPSLHGDLYARARATCSKLACQLAQDRDRESEGESESQSESNRRPELSIHLVHLFQPA